MHLYCERYLASPNGMELLCFQNVIVRFGTEYYAPVGKCRRFRESFRHANFAAQRH
jgi:hypothetical protein